MNKLTFTIPGPPVPAARPRMFKRGKFTGVFMPAKHKAYEKHASLCAWVAAHNAGWVKPGKEARIGLTLRIYRETRRGDLDNHGKMQMDSITRATNIWHDDRQVVAINAAMAHSATNPRVEVEIVVFR
jgi:Holliday junction resolvase RusA-like endonuclease